MPAECLRTLFRNAGWQRLLSLKRVYIKRLPKRNLAIWKESYSYTKRRLSKKTCRIKHSCVAEQHSLWTAWKRKHSTCTKRGVVVRTQTPTFKKPYFVWKEIIEKRPIYIKRDPCKRDLRWYKKRPMKKRRMGLEWDLFIWLWQETYL